MYLGVIYFIENEIYFKKKITCSMTIIIQNGVSQNIYGYLFIYFCLSVR